MALFDKIIKIMESPPERHLAWLPAGQHRVVLEQLKIATTARRQDEVYLMIPCRVVTSSDVGLEGQCYAQVWFIAAPGYMGQHETRRAFQFFEAVASSLGETTDATQHGPELMSGALLGLVLDATVTTKPSRTNPARSIADVAWAPVEQDAAMVRLAAAETHVLSDNPDPRWLELFRTLGGGLWK